MMFFLVSTAFAGVLWEEDQLQTECVDPGTCLVVLGEVIDAGCRSSSQDQYGIIYREFRADIRILEDSDFMAEGTEFTLHTASSDYSYADEEVGVPGCTLYDPGHPIGEIARYYLSLESVDGVYALFGSETFFHTDESAPDPEPLCAELEDWDPEGGNDGEAENLGDDVELNNSKEGGCASVSATGSSWLWVTGVLGLLMRRRGRNAL